MPDPKQFEACFLCRQAFEFGSRAYEGRKNPSMGNDGLHKLL